MKTSPVERVEQAAVGLAVVVGIALRVWLLRSHLGHVDADEAVVGVMAHALADGEWTTFYWGQTQGAATRPSSPPPSSRLSGRRPSP